LSLSREESIIAMNCSISIKDTHAGDHLAEVVPKLKEAAQQIEKLHNKG